MTPVLLALLVFAAAAAGDVVEAYFVDAVGRRAPARAAAMSVCMWGVGLVGWVVVLQVSWWYLIAEVAGLAVGSWVAVRRLQRNTSASVAVAGA